MIDRRTVLGMSAAGLAVPALAKMPLKGALVAKSMIAEIDAAIASAIKDNAAPGFSVGVMRRGQLLFAKGYGLANLETGTPVRPETVFRLGSISKQFTAAAVAKLAEQGKLSWTDPVAKHLPFFAGKPDVTLAELAHHTAGLHSDESGEVGAGGQAHTQVALAEEIAGQKQLFDFAPGTAWLYSNANYIVLGAVIEKVAKMSFAAAIEQLLFLPLQPTSLAIDLSSEVVAHRASGYTQRENGGFDNALAIEISDAGGAGALRGTATDVCRWQQALMAGKVLGPTGFAFMLTPGRLRDGRLASENRFREEDRGIGAVQYGGGLYLSEAGMNPRTFSHNGFIYGFSGVSDSDLDHGVSFAVLGNGDPGPALPFRAIRAAIRKRLA